MPAALADRVTRLEAVAATDGFREWPERRPVHTRGDAEALFDAIIFRLDCAFSAVVKPTAHSIAKAAAETVGSCVEDGLGPAETIINAWYEVYDSLHRWSAMAGPEGDRSDPHWLIIDHYIHELTGEAHAASPSAGAVMRRIRRMWTRLCDARLLDT
jgi:hypothetical protein